jgi:phosphohistidine phosphatase SixA
LVGEVTGSVAELPTAAIAVIDLAGDWASLAPGTGELTALWTPKMSE